METSEAHRVNSEKSVRRAYGGRLQQRADTA